jgi:hypothetical protein
MSSIAIELNSPQLRKHSKLFAEVVRSLIQALVMVNRIELRSDKKIPPLYKAGVRYQREGRGKESFQDVYNVLANKVGDCEDLCAWRVAELQEAGENASIRVKWAENRKTGKKLFHIQVRRGNGSIEDPSRLLGM